MSEIEKQEKRNEAFTRLESFIDILAAQGALSVEEIEYVESLEVQYWENV